LQRDEGNRYERSLIRPRLLITALNDVSEEATTALREEFPELRPLMDSLRTVGRTPFDATEVPGIPSLTLAKEVGLLGTYELAPGGKISRYYVSELYRIGLNLSRKGQA